MPCHNPLSAAVAAPIHCRIGVGYAAPLQARHALLPLLFLLAGCSGMSGRDQNTAVGAGAGAVAGAVLTGGSAVGTVGGAAVGGIIGNQVGKDPKR